MEHNERKTEKFCVTGMTCSACSARVEKAVASVPGVQEVAVSLLTHSMTVQGSASPREIAAAVRKAGYGIGTPEPQKERDDRKNTLRNFWISLGLLLLLMTLTMGTMWGIVWPAFFTPLWQGIGQAVLSLAILLSHRNFFLRGGRAALHGSPNMDTLVAMGSGVSYGYSLVLLVLGAADPQTFSVKGLYFESAAMILVLIAVGKLLEEKSKGKTTSALKALMALAPETAAVLRDGEETELPVSLLSPGDEIVVRPGERIPADGTVSLGESAVEESALTGESIPVDKAVGDPVYTGTSNLSGTLVIRCEAVGENTALSRIIDRVSTASASKAPIARLADRVSAVFVPVVLGISLVTLAIHLVCGTEFSRALSHAITVLVVSCPCALGLATPVAIMVGSGVAASHGVLFKTATSLEEAGRVTTVILDKTGTVTRGEMTVREWFPAEGVSAEEFLSLAASLEWGSTHPIARAIVQRAEEEGIPRKPVSEFESRAAFGVRGICEGELLLGGKPEFVVEEGREALQKSAKVLSQKGSTPVFFSRQGKFLGVITVQDTVKEDSAEAVSQLKQMGLRVVMVTGDRPEVAKTVADSVGIDQVFASVLPEGKEDLVRSFQKKGKVCMVGDGINDSPALTAADLGVAIGTGVDIAVDAAEVVLLRESLLDLPRLIGLSRKTLRTVKQNLFWAFCYNLVGIPLAAGAFIPLFSWELGPMFGAAAMSFSSLFVVSNALRLNWYSWHRKENVMKEEKEKKNMETVLKIEGMMCPHCEAHVKRALEALEGVERAEPSHEKGEARIFSQGEISPEILRQAVEQIGYRVVD